MCYEEELEVIYGGTTSHINSSCQLAFSDRRTSARYLIVLAVPIILLRKLFYGRTGCRDPAHGLNCLGVHDIRGVMMMVGPRVY